MAHHMVLAMLVAVTSKDRLERVSVAVFLVEVTEGTGLVLDPVMADEYRHLSGPPTSTSLPFYHPGPPYSYLRDFALPLDRSLSFGGWAASFLGLWPSHPDPCQNQAYFFSFAQ